MRKNIYIKQKDEKLFKNVERFAERINKTAIDVLLETFQANINRLSNLEEKTYNEGYDKGFSDALKIIEEEC